MQNYTLSTNAEPKLLQLHIIRIVDYWWRRRHSRLSLSLPVITSCRWR